MNSNTAAILKDDYAGFIGGHNGNMRLSKKSGEEAMLDKKTLFIVAAILASSVFVTGGMFIFADRLDRRFELESGIAGLKAENAKLEVLLDQALKTLHHERLLHFGTKSDDMEGRK